MSTKKTTIEALAAGEVVLNYMGNNLDKLKRVLNLAFPNDKKPVHGGRIYYSASAVHDGCWNASDYMPEGLVKATLEDFQTPEEEAFQYMAEIAEQLKEGNPINVTPTNLYGMNIIKYFG